MPPLKKKRAVFMDRDGTIIRQVELLHKVPQLRLLPGVATAVRAFNQLGYLTIVVSNQPVVARGIIGREKVDEIHAALIERLEKHGAKLDAIYFCPHHPEANVKKYRKHCKCRKPETGMIMKAAKRFGIDLKESFVIGDSTRDTLAGNRAELTTILVRTGHGGKDVWQFGGKPDLVARNLAEAVEFIRRKE